jgi:hypothetical protein
MAEPDFGTESLEFILGNKQVKNRTPKEVQSAAFELTFALLEHRPNDFDHTAWKSAHEASVTLINEHLEGIGNKIRLGYYADKGITTDTANVRNPFDYNYVYRLLTLYDKLVKMSDVSSRKIYEPMKLQANLMRVNNIIRDEGTRWQVLHDVSQMMSHDSRYLDSSYTGSSEDGAAGRGTVKVINIVPRALNEVLPLLLEKYEGTINDYKERKRRLRHSDRVDQGRMQTEEEFKEALGKTLGIVLAAMRPLYGRNSANRVGVGDRTDIIKEIKRGVTAMLENPSKYSVPQVISPGEKTYS